MPVQTHFSWDIHLFNNAHANLAGASVPEFPPALKNHHKLLAQGLFWTAPQLS